MDEDDPPRARIDGLDSVDDDGFNVGRGTDGRAERRKRTPKAERPAPGPAKREATGPDPFEQVGARVGLSGRTLELLLGGLAVVAAIALTAYLARGMWFNSDEWEFIANRSAFDVGDLTRPMGGHWATWSVLLLRAIHQVAGIDFWPWYYLPRLIGHTLLAVLIWRVVRRRGADPVIAFLGFTILLVLGASGYQRALQVGNWVVYAALIVAALIITRREKPTVRDQVLVGVVLLVGVLGNGYSVAMIGGIGLGLLCARRLVRWLPAIAPAGLAYVAWWLHYRDDIKPKPELDIANVLEIPWSSFRVLRRAVEAATWSPTWLASILVVALLAWIVVLAVRRRFDLFDQMVLWTLAVGLALLSVQRIAFDAEAADRLRYGYSVSILLAIALVPHIPRPRGIPANAGVVVLWAWLLIANVHQMDLAIDVREDVAQTDRLLTVTAANMIADGEPVVAGPAPLNKGPDVQELRRLVEEDGYLPDPLPDDQTDREEIVATTRGILRMDVIDAHRPRLGYRPPEGEAPTTDTAVDADGCVTLVEGEPVELTVTDAGTLAVDKLRNQSLRLDWEDEFGVGRRFYDDVDIRSALIELADPTSEATLTLTSQIDDMTVCGIMAEE
jgi:hypothetical protein